MLGLGGSLQNQGKGVMGAKGEDSPKNDTYS